MLSPGRTIIVEPVLLEIFLISQLFWLLETKSTSVKDFNYKNFTRDFHLSNDVCIPAMVLNQNNVPEFWLLGNQFFKIFWNFRWELHAFSSKYCVGCSDNPASLDGVSERCDIRVKSRLTVKYFVICREIRLGHPY